MYRTVIYVGEDRDFSRMLSGLKWDGTDDVYRVSLAVAEAEPDRFETGPRFLAIVDWQINVGKVISTSRLRRFILALTAREVKTVVVAGMIHSPRLVVEVMEAGATSFFEKGHDSDDLRQWLERVWALPPRRVFLESNPTAEPA